MTDRELLEHIRELIKTTIDDSEELPMIIYDLIVAHLDGGDA